MDQSSFRARIGSTDSFATNQPSLYELPVVPSGGAPAPFNALNSLRMSGPMGSHPLAAIDLPQLVAGPTSKLEGAIALTGPVRVGEAISGRIQIRARQRIEARTAVLRLIGIRLHEDAQSGPKRSPEEIAISQGLGSISKSLGSMNINFTTGTGADSTKVQETVSWVEVHASEVDSLPFAEPALPACSSRGRPSTCRSRSLHRAWARPRRMPAWPRSRGPWRRTGTSGWGRTSGSRRSCT